MPSVEYSDMSFSCDVPDGPGVTPPESLFVTPPANAIDGMTLNTMTMPSKNVDVNTQRRILLPICVLMTPHPYPSVVLREITTNFNYVEESRLSFLLRHFTTLIEWRILCCKPVCAKP
jgi:hypothetical protein